MSPVDVGILAIVGLSGFFGLVRGAVREIFGLATLVLGLLLAFSFYPDAAERLAPWIHDRLLAEAAGFFGIWLSAWIVFAGVGALLRRLLRTLALGWLDRLAGFAFGLARGALLVSLVVWALTAFQAQPRRMVRSPLSLRILEVGDAMKRAFPPDFRERFTKGLVDAKSQLMKNHPLRERPGIAPRPPGPKPTRSNSFPAR